MTATAQRFKRAHDRESLPIDILDFAQASFAYNAGAESAALIEGLYDVWSDQDCYLKVSRTDATDVLTTTGYLLFANNIITVMIGEGEFLGAIKKTNAGTLYYHKVG